MPYFVLIDDTEMKMLLGAVTFLTRHHEGQLGEILRERIAKRSQGKAAVFEWKVEQHDEIINMLDQLDMFRDKLRSLPTGQDRDLV